MSNPFPNWTAQLNVDGKFIAVPAITRASAYAFILHVASDVSADAFASSIRLAPDAAGATLANFTVSVGSYASGETPVTFSLTGTQTGALPTDNDADGIEFLVFDILHTPLGLGAYRCAGGIIPLSGAIT